MSDMFNIGLNSLNAYQTALTVTSQNIGNVNTPFYSRRQVDFAEAAFSNGVNVADIRRVYDSSTSKSLSKANSAYAMSDMYTQQLGQIETLVGNTTNSISTYIDNSIKALRELDTNADSIQSRNNYLYQLNILSNRFNSIGKQLDEQQNNINQSIESTITNVNQLTSQIAEINNKIVTKTGGDTVALYDEREKLIQELSTYMDFSTQETDNGEINIALSNGSLLVFSNQANKISAVTNPADPSTLTLSLASSTTTTDITSYVKGGQIGGLYNTQEDLREAQRTLGRLALGMMDTFNQQNQLGVDLNGTLGGNIFTDVNNANAINNRAISNAKNVGVADVTVNIDDISQLTTDDYQLVFDTATHYNLVRLSDNSVVSTGAVGAMPMQISADGFTINIASATITAGDKYTISPTRSIAEDMSVGITDPKLLALAWPVSAQFDPQNKGQGEIVVTNILDTTNSSFSTPHALNPPIDVVFISSTQYQLVDASTSTVIDGPFTYDPSGTNIFPTIPPGNYDPGYRVQISGIVEAGDKFSLTYNENTGGDNRNGLVMEDLFTKRILQNGTMTFAEAYNSLVNNIASQDSAARIDYESNKSIQAQAQQSYDQVSGVQLQEETINLAKYQQAYQASAQIIQVAKDIFDTIIRLGG